mmetsp:Transcript_43553/g.71015  ORF Transcript_43553/g.71015 Transcript_43553/m.71015 type:complete len:120 (-) Transcript_43553:26-385(-)
MADDECHAVVKCTIGPSRRKYKQLEPTTPRLKSKAPTRTGSPHRHFAIQLAGDRQHFVGWRNAFGVLGSGISVADGLGIKVSGTNAMAFGGDLNRDIQHQGMTFWECARRAQKTHLCAS